MVYSIPPVQTSVKMESASIRILDEALYSGGTSSNHLLCTVDHQFIGLAIADVNKKSITAFEAFHFPSQSNELLSKRIESLPAQSDILKKIDFQNVSVQLCSRQYTFVPAALFHKESIESNYFLVHPKENNIEIKTDALAVFNLVNLFSLSQGISASLKKIFEQFTIRHHISTLLKSIAAAGYYYSDNNRERESNIFLHFHSEYMDVIVVEGRNLLLCNTFHYKTAEDALYYLLFVSEQLKMDLKNSPVKIYGEIEKESALSNLFQKHVLNLTFGERHSLKLSQSFDKLPAHFYPLIFSHAASII